MPEAILLWFGVGERLIRSDIWIKMFDAVQGVLPEAGLTDEQIAGLVARRTRMLAVRDEVARDAGDQL